MIADAAVVGKEFALLVLNYNENVAVYLVDWSITVDDVHSGKAVLVSGVEKSGNELAVACVEVLEEFEGDSVVSSLATGT